LRSPHILDITKLGIKSINISRNNFGDYFAEQLSLALKADEYTKCLTIKNNKIGVSGIKFLAEAVF
jgi:Ran GTPase-activating protein (RanGAP) involved in mRNA processing and transport